MDEIPARAVYYVTAFLLFTSVVTFPSLFALAFHTSKKNRHPRAWVYEIVWGFIYVLIWVAGMRFIVSARGDILTVGGLLYTVSHILNVMWTPLYFGAHEYVAGTVIMGLLMLTSVGTTILFFMVDTLAGVLILPYPILITYFFVTLAIKMQELNTTRHRNRI